jgi:hypothetical protein
MGCTRSMQCNVEFGKQLSIFSRIEKKHGKTSSSWPVAASGSVLICSQQFGVHVREKQRHSSTVLLLYLKMYKGVLHYVTSRHKYIHIPCIRSDQLGSLLMQLQYIMFMCRCPFTVFTTGCSCRLIFSVCSV